MKIFILIGMMLVLLAPILGTACGNSSQAGDSPTQPTSTPGTPASIITLQQEIAKLTKRVGELEQRVGGTYYLSPQSLDTRISAIERQLERQSWDGSLR